MSLLNYVCYIWRKRIRNYALSGLVNVCKIFQSDPSKVFMVVFDRYKKLERLLCNKPYDGVLGAAQLSNHVNASKSMLIHVNACKQCSFDRQTD